MQRCPCTGQSTLLCTPGIAPVGQLHQEGAIACKVDLVEEHGYLSSRACKHDNGMLDIQVDTMHCI
jgi:hypothetical protein